MQRSPSIAWLVLVGASLATTVGAARADEPPPPGLGCLAAHLAGTAARGSDGAWGLRLADGTQLRWDRGGAPRPFEAQLDDPDLRDMLRQPYRTGPIRPVTTVDEDPGRVRVEPLLRAAYPPARTTRLTFLGRPLTVHEKVKEPLLRVAARLERALAADPSLRVFVDKLGGGFNDRTIAGTTRKSAHSFGLAIDVNPARSDYWRWAMDKTGKVTWKNRVPQALVDAFEAEHFIWGGRWYHYDTMHFEYRPELFDPECRP